MRASRSGSSAMSEKTGSPNSRSCGPDCRQAAEEGAGVWEGPALRILVRFDLVTAAVTFVMYRLTLDE